MDTARKGEGMQPHFTILAIRMLEPYHWWFHQTKSRSAISPLATLMAVVVKYSKKSALQTPWQQGVFG